MIYIGRLGHHRTRPVRHRFTYRTLHWLIDVDHVPQLARGLRFLGRIDGRDHFDGTEPDLRVAVDRFLAMRGIGRTDGRILMLAGARMFGYVFNPLTVFWRLDSDGRVNCAIAEVHNTYGQRHCYILHPDRDDQAQFPKRFYVSPFFPVAGEYHMRLPVPGEHLDLRVALRMAGRTAFVARLRGRARPLNAVNLIRHVLRQPWPTLQLAIRIRSQGIRLLLRGLPIFPQTPGGDVR